MEAKMVALKSGGVKVLSRTAFAASLIWLEDSRTRGD